MAKSTVTKIYAYETGIGLLHRSPRDARYHLAAETIKNNLVPYSVDKDKTMDDRTSDLIVGIRRLDSDHKKKLLAALKLYLDPGEKSEKEWEEWTPEVDGLPKPKEEK